jgi:hypothetical protein
MMPDGRQPDFSSMSAVTLPGGRRWCCCSDLYTPSGLVPGGVEIGALLKLLVRIRTTLQRKSLVGGPFCNVQGPYSNFLFLRGLWISCTVFHVII